MERSLGGWKKVREKATAWTDSLHLRLVELNEDEKLRILLAKKKKA